MAGDGEGFATGTGRHDRVLRHRWVILAVAIGSAAVVAGGRGDWNQFVDAGRSLVHEDGLRFYTRHGDAQTGAVSLLLAVTLAGTGWRNGFVLEVVLCAVLGLVAVALAESIGRDSRRQGRRALTEIGVLIGGSLVLFAWAKLGGYGHLDDAIVLTSAAAAVWACSRRSAVLTAMLVGVAIAVKPWGVIFMPLTLVPNGSSTTRLRSPSIAIAIGALAWLPFIVYEPATLRSLHPTVRIADDSVLALFGMSGAPPSWLRIGQLLLATSVAYVAVRRGNAVGAVLGAVAVRLALDAGTWSYYTPGLVLGALLWDLGRRRELVPWTTIAVTIMLLPRWVVPNDHLRGVMRLLVCLLAVAMVSVQRGQAREPLATEPMQSRIS